MSEDPILQKEDTKPDEQKTVSRARLQEELGDVGSLMRAVSVSPQTVGGYQGLRILDMQSGSYIEELGLRKDRPSAGGQRQAPEGIRRSGRARRFGRQERPSRSKSCATGKKPSSGMMYKVDAMFDSFSKAATALRVSVLFLALFCAQGFPSAAPAWAEPESGLTLDFKDADIHALIKYISEATGRNFITDPTVKGKVTVYSPVKISPG